MQRLYLDKEIAKSIPEMSRKPMQTAKLPRENPTKHADPSHSDSDEALKLL